MNLNEISLFLTEPIVIIPGEILKEAPIKEKELAPQNNLLLEDEKEKNMEENDVRELDVASFEGSFQKGLLVLYQGRQLSEPSQLFLMNILKAVNHSLKDIALISEEELLNGHPDSINRLNPQNILIFGKLNHSIMQFKREDYAIVQADQTCLFSDDLREIEANKPLKIKLWTALQVLFNIKS